MYLEEKSTIPIRILHVIGGLNLGGAENFLMNIYRNIDRSKIQFDFLVNRGGAFEDEIKELGGKIFYIPALQKVGPIIYKKKLHEFYRQHKEYLIVHSHLNQVSGIILEVSKKEKIPVRIAHSHSSSNFANNFFERLYKNYLNTKINKNATNFFACSDDAAKWLYKEKAKEAIIIKNAIDIERFKFNEEKRNLIRKELNIDESDIVIGHVGRFSSVKNHKFLIELFNEFQKDKKNSKLLLVGDGPLKNEIENQIVTFNIKDKVILVGNKKNVEDYYNAMDLFVFPSLYEGLGMVLIEAQINGLNCLTSKDAVPNEVNITNHVKFVSLDEDIKGWNKILNEMNIARYSELEKIEKAGYNVREECKKLERIYLNYKKER